MSSGSLSFRCDIGSFMSPFYSRALQNDNGYPFKFNKKQSSICLCFAMTINKAQGQTILNIGIYFQSVFSHRQLYITLSRGISIKTTKVWIKLIGNSKLPSNCTKDIVYRKKNTSMQVLHLNF